MVVGTFSTCGHLSCGMFSNMPNLGPLGARSSPDDDHQEGLGIFIHSVGRGVKLKPSIAHV